MTRLLSRRAVLCALTLVLPIAILPRADAQTFQSNVVTSDGGVNISSLLGTSAFYNAGYTGTRAIVSNIEGGFFYKYHPDLTNQTVQLNYGGTYPAPLGPDPNDPSQNAVHDPNLTGDPLWTQYDTHATAVAGVIGTAPEYAGDPKAGIAYGATLVGGTLATSWDNALSFEVSDKSFFTPYIEALQTGITPLGGRLSNVVNGSYGYQDSAYSAGGTATSGADSYTVGLDGLARSSGATVVWASGNNGYGHGNVNDPAAGYNGISVGASDSGSRFTTVAGFSSGGPSDFLAPGGAVISSVRATVDIIAPGSSIYTAVYYGATGGNTGQTPSSNPVPSNYGSYSAGTSFAAPMVAGVATLLCDVGNAQYGGGGAVNGMVIKAVLLNSADKIAGWNNGQTTVNGVVTTTQALDYASGAGELDAGRAFTQYTGGTTNVSHGQPLVAPATVANLGWDYGYLAPTSLNVNPENDYYILPALQGGTSFTGTLSWYVDRTFDGLVNDSTGTPTATASDLRFTNLDLELWSVANGLPSQMVAFSGAQYISTQHFFFTLPSSGQYMLRVLWAGDQYDVDNSDAQGQYYGLAWSGTALAGSASAPDASAILLFIAGGGMMTLLLWRRRRQRPACASNVSQRA